MPIFRSILVAAVFLPQSAFGASIVADDSIAGLGTSISVSELEPREAVTVVVTPPLGSEIVLQKQADDEGGLEISLKGRDTEVAGIYAVNLEQLGRALDATVEFEVLTESLSLLESTISTLQDPTSSELDITVTLVDTYGNPLPNRPVELISSNPSDSFRKLASETDEAGKITFIYSGADPAPATIRAIDLLSASTLSDALSVGSAIGGPAEETAIEAPAPTPARAPTSTTRAPDGRILYRGSAGQPAVRGSNFRAQLSYGLVDHFIITAPDELQQNEDATITITAVDRNGTRVEDYTGLALLSSTDPDAYLPVNGLVQFEPRNLGEKVLTLGLRFRNPSSPELPHVLFVEDSQNPDVYGQAYVEVTGVQGQSVAKVIQVTAPEINSLLSSTEVQVTGITEPFVNLIVEGGVEEVRGDTQIDGKFSITVQLDPTKTEHTLRVKDEFGLLDSGEFNVALDITPPIFTALSYIPESPTEGQDVLLVVETDPNLPSVSVDLFGTIYPLEPVPGQPSKYQLLFSAPGAGGYQPIIYAEDVAGNVAQLDSSLVTQLRGLPAVTNLVATSEQNGVTLQWDAVTSETIDAYRIYVGQSPTEFDFSLDTDSPTTAAQVAGLTPGQEYFFAVTALQGQRESADKSEVAVALIEGIELFVKAQENSLAIDWSSLSTDLPLSSFVLEYGVEPGVYSEKRIINGDLRNYILRDLLNDVAYFLKLTPVSVTGQPIDELSAEAEGTPLSVVAGFTPTPGEEVPFDTSITKVRASAPPNLHSGAPQTSNTGLPTGMWWMMVLSLGLGLLVYWKRRRTLHTSTDFLRQMDIHYRKP